MDRVRGMGMGRNESPAASNRWLHGEIGGRSHASPPVERRLRANLTPLRVGGVSMAALEGREERREAGDDLLDLVSAGDRTVGELLLRGLNLLVAVVALVIFAPAMVLIAVAIKLDSRGPILYRQLRIGLDRRRAEGRADDENKRTADLGGRPFVMYKYRTMHVDAEAETGPIWTAGFDDRVTRVGRFLRRHRLDELPQLWNVVRGQMSIVGPRPERPGFVHHLKHEIDGYRYRHRVRPGITGLAQVNREADTSIDDVRRKLNYDLDYIRRRSLLLDLSVMMRTPLVMIRRERLAQAAGGADEGEGEGR